MQVHRLTDFQGQTTLASVLVEQETRAVKEDTPLSNDSELFTRLAFDEDPRKGCELLFRRYYQMLCNHAVRFVYSRETAEDIVSDVFCKFWKTKAYEGITSSYRYYLFRSVRNEAYNYLRLEFQELDDIDRAMVQESTPSQRPDQILQFEEVLHKIEELVERMPPQCRKVFLLSRFEGKKYQAIALELGLSVKTVEVHIVKALSIVRQGLKEHWLMSCTSIWWFFAC